MSTFLEIDAFVAFGTLERVAEERRTRLSVTGP